MIVTLTDTTSSLVGAEVRRIHRVTGTGSGLVHTLVTICDSQHAEEALDLAQRSAQAHPCRLLMAVNTRSRRDRIDAEIRAGEGAPGDVIVMRLSGATVQHPEAVLRSLLLPDAPVIAWWPWGPPTQLSTDPLGALAVRRITDSASATDPCAALITRASHHRPGDSDLCWARTTPWRGLLAAALDQHPVRVHSARIESAPGNAPARLIGAWLGLRLGVEVTHAVSDQPGIASVSLTTAGGDIEVRRIDGRSAVYRIPGEPARSVALERREVPALMAEELRRLDDDVVQGEVMDALDRGVGLDHTTGGADS